MKESQEKLGDSKGYDTIDEFTLPVNVLQSTTEYHRPGLPSPPAGWGKAGSVAPMPAEMCK